MIMNYYLTGSRNKATIIVKTKKVCLFLFKEIISKFYKIE